MEEYNVQVSDIMSRNLKVLHPKSKLISAKEIFEEYDIHHIPVAVMGDVKGIISQGDILFLEGVVNNSFDEFIRTKKYEISTVDEIMTSRPYTIESDKLISEALDIMIEKRVNCLPVKENLDLIGVITNYDILKHFRKALKNE